jgi:hypothetical protein
VDSDDGHASLAPSRRELLVRGLGAGAGLLIGGRLIRPGAATAAGPTVLLSASGVVGDGSTDDTAAIQAALNAAGSGTTLLGEAGKVYVITSTLSFPADAVTLDLGGGSIVIGTTRALGSELQTNDTMFEVNGRSRVRITNGTILAARSPYRGGGLPYRIHVPGGSGCRIDNLTADCDGSLFVYLAGQQHTIASNSIKNGAISGVATSKATVQGNTLTNSPSNAISFTGYAGAPVDGTAYLDNVITGYGRVAIEEYSPNGAQYCTNPVFRGNTISAPSASNSNGTGISAICVGATIANNTITDAIAWAIEATGVGTTITGNTISWTPNNAAALSSTAIVVNTSLSTNLNQVTVSQNTITGGAIGIQMFGSAFYCPTTISANTITNTTTQAIVLAPAANAGLLPSNVLIQATNNVINFTEPPLPSTTRYGIVTASTAVLTGNQIRYTKSSYRPGVYDISYAFSGNAVIMNTNLADGGGRTDGHVVSGSLGGSWIGWILISNRFINGAACYTSGLVLPVSLANTGVS